MTTYSFGTLHELGGGGVRGCTYRLYILNEQKVVVAMKVVVVMEGVAKAGETV